jgi:hypothetical protein
VYAKERFVSEKPAQAALDQARQTWAPWEGNEKNRGDSKDPYYQLCFGKQDPLDSAFEEIAAEIFEPLLKHLKKV